MSRPTHVFDGEEPIFEQLHPGMVFITRDGGHIVRVIRVDEAADEITLTYQSTGDREMRSGDEMWAFCDHEAFAVPPEVLLNPERVVTEYAWFHLGRDLETIGRSHEHHIAGSERVSDIEFAVWATNEARRDNWPPDDAAGVYLGDSLDEEAR
jgi:hypothetical protein